MRTIVVTFIEEKPGVRASRSQKLEQDWGTEIDAAKL